MLKIGKHVFCLKNIDKMKKNDINKIVFTFDYIGNSIGKFGPNWFIGYRDTKFRRKYIFNFIYQDIQKTMANIEKIH